MKVKKKLIRHLFISYLIILVFSLIPVMLLMIHAFREEYLRQTRHDLRIRISLFQHLLPERISYSGAERINRLCIEIGKETGTRFTVVLSTGKVIGESDGDYRKMDNHADRPELTAAFSGGEGSSIRYSYTLEKELMYLALPLLRHGTIVGAVRASMPVATIAGDLRVLYLRIAVMVVIVIVVMIVSGFGISRLITKPLKEIVTGVGNIADGDFTVRIAAESTYELEKLAEAINSMAAQLDERVRSLVEQRNKLEAVMSGMIEAIIVVDTEERVVEYNRATTDLFRLSGENLRGKHVQELIRNVKLERFIQVILEGNGFAEEEIPVHGEDDRVLQAHGTQFLDAQGNRIGAIIVLNDITRIKKLETIRRDFVANVTHELRTPLTSIAGFVETLRDGAVDDIENRYRFLDIILKHVKRLDNIIEDLLSLSNIEQQVDNRLVVFENNSLKDILVNAVSLCSVKAADKNITITLDCPDISVRSNARMLEQAVVNLVDNAVKYSDTGSTVTVRAQEKDGETVIEVIDTGCGIPQEHLPRIFERFYRVDKGRSRDLGGTGLGLSIVRHIVNYHGGRVSVDSSPGNGSTFTIILPAY